MYTLEAKTSARNQFVDITSMVRDVISKSGIIDGTAVVYCPHTTAGMTINEAADPSVAHDIINKLSEIIPYQGPYRHAEGNSDAHVKASLVGSSIQVIVDHGAPVLGTWQGIFLCEFDGPRRRKVFVKVMEA